MEFKEFSRKTIKEGDKEVIEIQYRNEEAFFGKLKLSFTLMAKWYDKEMLRYIDDCKIEKQI